MNLQCSIDSIADWKNETFVIWLFSPSLLLSLLLVSFDVLVAFGPQLHLPLGALGKLTTHVQLKENNQTIKMKEQKHSDSSQMRICQNVVSLSIGSWFFISFALSSILISVMSWSLGWINSNSNQLNPLGGSLK